MGDDKSLVAVSLHKISSCSVRRTKTIKNAILRKFDPRNKSAPILLLIKFPFTTPPTPTTQVLKLLYMIVMNCPASIRFCFYTQMVIKAQMITPSLVFPACYANVTYMTEMTSGASNYRPAYELKSIAVNCHYSCYLHANVLQVLLQV